MKSPLLSLFVPCSPAVSHCNTDPALKSADSIWRVLVIVGKVDENVDKNIYSLCSLNTCVYCLSLLTVSRLHRHKVKGKFHRQETNVHDTGRRYNTFYFGFLSSEKACKEKSSSANASLN